jgi:hypothetical protein
MLTHLLLHKRPTAGLKAGRAGRRQQQQEGSLLLEFIWSGIMPEMQLASAKWKKVIP